jgi:hypothetical protein
MVNDPTPEKTSRQLVVELYQTDKDARLLRNEVTRHTGSEQKGLMQEWKGILKQRSEVRAEIDRQKRD